MKKCKSISIYSIMILCAIFVFSFQAKADTASAELKSIKIGIASSQFKYENFDKTGAIWQKMFKKFNAERIQDNVFYVNIGNTTWRNLIIAGERESATAEIFITNMTDVENTENKNLDIDYNFGYTVDTNSGKKAENPFITTDVGDGGTKNDDNLYLKAYQGASCYKLTVKDEDISKSYYLVIGNSGEKTNTKGSYVLNYQPEKIEIYNGETQEILNPQYQYFSHSVYASVSKENVLPDSVKSIRLKLTKSVKEPEKAYADAAELEDYYHINDNYVSINGGEWKRFDGNGIWLSQELVLEKGWNLLVIRNRTDEELEFKTALPQYGASVLMVYRESENTYQPEKGTNAEINGLEIYRCTQNGNFETWREYKKFDIFEENNRELIDISSEDEQLMFMLSPQDAAAKVQIGDATQKVGGCYLFSISPEDYNEDTPIAVSVVPENGDKEAAFYKEIYIRWNKGNSEFRTLDIEGADLSMDYEKNQDTYEITNITEDRITYCYTLAEGCTVQSVLADGEMVEATETSFQVPKTVKEVVVTLHAEAEGLPSESKYYFEIPFEKMAADTSKAETMSKKFWEAWDKDYGNNYKNSYWETFEAVSSNRDLKDALLYDVETHKFHQATDYAAVILELIMAGENPYNYQGHNYVEGLQAEGEKYGGFSYGPYACNIWALWALDAAGADYDEGLIDTVVNQAASSSFDLDMRGWALSAASNHVDVPGVQEKITRAIRNIQNERLVKDGNMAGSFQHKLYKSINSNTHGCVISGLIANGIDITGEEWTVKGQNPVDVLQKFQTEDGLFYYATEDDGESFTFPSYNKDAVIALGDITSGTNVFKECKLTEKEAEVLLKQAEDIVSRADAESLDELNKAIKNLQEALIYGNFGQAYFELQDAMYQIQNSVKTRVFFCTEEERQLVLELEKEIEELLNLENVSLKRIEELKNTYEGMGGENVKLKEKLQSYVTNLNLLVRAEGYLGLVEKTEAIGAITENSEEPILEAEEYYESLDTSLKEEELVQKQYALIQESRKIFDVVHAIADITRLEEITLSHKAQIEEVRIAYDLLGDLKGKVTNASLLVAAEQRLKDLQSVKAVEDLIAALPNPEQVVYEEHAEAIRKAHMEYEKLTDTQKELIGQEYKGKLAAGYEEVLKQQSDEEAVQDVIKNIEALPAADELTEDNYKEYETLVLSVRGLYDSLSTETLKERVTNRDRLFAAEEKIAEMKKGDLLHRIAELPAPEDIQGIEPDESDMQVTEEQLQNIAEVMEIYQSMAKTDQEIFANEYPEEYEKLQTLHELASQYEGYIEKVLAPLAESIRAFELPVTRYNLGLAQDLAEKYDANENAAAYLDNIVWEDGTALKDKIGEMKAQAEQVKMDIEAAAAVDAQIEELGTMAENGISRGNSEYVRQKLDELQTAYVALSFEAQSYVANKDRWESVESALEDYDLALRKAEEIMSKLETAAKAQNLLDKQTVVTIKEAEAAYEALEPSAKVLVSEEVLQAVSEFKEQISVEKTRVNQENEIAMFNGTIPWDIVVEVRKEEEGKESWENLRKALKEEKKAVIQQAFSINVYRILEDGSNEAYLPQGGMSFTVHTRDDLSGKEVVLGCLNTDNTVEFLQTVQNGKDITFTAQSLSVFAAGVVQEKDSEPSGNENGEKDPCPNGDSGQGSNDKNQKPSSNQPGDKNKETDGKKKTPKTGDEMPVQTAGMLLILSGIAVLSLCQKKKE